jgi:hypothetical protein
VVTYAGASTPLLTYVSPRYAPVQGGDAVTFTGEDFSDQTADYTITIDGIDCEVTAATTTSVTCTTGPRPGIVVASLEINIAGKGLVALQDHVFYYVNAWSIDATWGGEFAPMDGESIHIPHGLNLLVDIDATPILMAVIVEGSLFIAPDEDEIHHRSIDAHYIFINHGKMEVGTEDYPYSSKITITMHGNIKSPYLPIYGNKVIGLHHG